MRNLTQQTVLRIGDACELEGAQDLCVDYDTREIYVINGQKIFSIEPSTQEVRERALFANEGELVDGQNADIVNATHLPDQMVICIVTAVGNVIVWNSTTDQVENVGCVNCGITSAQWSPDHEILALTTGENKLVLMTREFDVLSEFDLCPGSFGEAQFVNVGWGKKETQFHGTEGKEAAKVKPQTAREAFTWDDKKPRITWTGDGQYFAVSVVNSNTGSREIKVWTREGTLHSSSEVIDGLENALCWRPSGGFLAASQRKPNKHDIIFVERNGLKHREFSLPFGVNDIKVKEILWNNDSTILAIWGENLPESNQPLQSFIQLWTTGNYHWYLKAHLEFGKVSQSKISNITWDPENAYCMHVVCENGQYLRYTWGWTTDHSVGGTSDDQSTVAVIDGGRLLMTPFKSMVVPPPMSAYQISLQSNVQQVSFAAGTHSNKFLVIMDDLSLAYYNFDQSNGDSSVKPAACGGNGFKVMCEIPSLVSMLSLFGIDSLDTCFPGAISHLNFVDESLIYFMTLNPMGSGSVLHHARLDLESKCVHVEHSIDTDHSIMMTTVNQKNCNFIMEAVDGSLLQYDPESKTILPLTDSTGREIIFPQPCSKVSMCTLNGKDVVLGLTDRFRFFANDVEVASNCTSFAVHRDFILLSTHSHTVRCISTTLDVDDLPRLADGKAHPFDESVRRVERGSRIVCVVPTDTKLVLQMPRGNLEAVHPRALVLSTVRSHIDSLRYKEAFSLMRKHRINMNLLHDHNPSAFMENVRTFVEQIESVNFINLFLTDLHDEDVTVTMYTAAYNGRVSQTKTSSKMDAVCEAVRKVLQEINAEKYLSSILTTYVKKSTPELQAALLLIQKLRDDSTAAAEEALKYLLFLVDVNELYDIALGTYDFDLVLMVAEKSQKDPKEYLPFLNNLRKLEDNYQKYSIDMHLKRYPSALSHIVKCGSEHFIECHNLIQQQKLYSLALKLYAADTEEYKEIALSYGEHLINERLYEDAGIIYTRSRHHELALEAYEKAHNWRQCLCLAQMLGYGCDKMVELARRLAAYMKDHHQHIEAAQLLDQYADDHEEAIVLLIEGGQWEESLRMMHKHKRTDFIESSLLPGLVEAHSTQMSLLTSTKELFIRHRDRLQVVREEAERKRQEMLELGEDGRGQAMDSDLFSDTSSATGETGSVMSGRSSRYSTTDSQVSGSSKMSGRSVKNRRKAERKKKSLKEGSRYEDLALMEALYNMHTQADSWADEIGALLRALALFQFDKEAEDLQAEMTAYMALLASSVTEIWIETKADSLETMFASMNFGPNTTSNALAQAVQQQSATPTATSSTSTEPYLQRPASLKNRTSWQLKMMS